MTTFALGPAVAEAAPLANTVSVFPNQVDNNGVKTITLTGTPPAAVFGDFTNTVRAVAYIPNARLTNATLPADDVNANGVDDCLEANPVPTGRCLIDSTIAPEDITNSGQTLSVQFNFNGKPPSSQWRLATFDASGASWKCDASANQSGDACLTVVGPGPTVTTTTIANGKSKNRAQGSGPIGVTVTGANYFPGTTIVPNGDLAGVTVTNLTQPNATTLSATLNVAADAPLKDNAIVVRSANGVDQTAIDVDIVAPPQITGFAHPSPATAEVAGIGRGASNRTLTVTGTGFSPTESTFSIPTGLGVSMTNPTVANATTGSITLTVSPSATPANVPVTVTVPSTGGSTSTNLAINPDFAVTSIAPTTLRETSANRTVTLTGTFRPGATVSISHPTKVAFDDAGAALEITETAIRFNVDVLAPANEGDVVTFTVNPNDGGPTKSGSVTIVGAPNVTAFGPTALGRGADNAPLVMTGTNLDPTATFTFSGAAGSVTAGPCTGSLTSVTCSTDVAADAELSARTLTISTEGEPDVTINSPTLGINAAPTLTTLTDAIGRGAVDEPIVAEGSGFVAGASIQLGEGTTVDGCTNTATTISCVADVSALVEPGDRDAAIVNGDYGRAPCPGSPSPCSVAITQAPAVTAVTPRYLSRGGAADLTVTGTDFATGLTLDFGTGIAVTNVVPAEDGTQATASVTVAQDAALSDRGATAVNGDGGRSTSEPVLAVIGPVSVSGITPNHLGAGADDATVTLTGTSLTPDTEVDLGPGVTVVSTATSGTDLTALEVVVDVASDAPATKRAVTVTNVDETTATLPAAFTVDPIPGITGFESDEVGQGAVEHPMTLLGTGFLAGATVDLGEGSTVEVVSVSPTEIDLLVSMADDAETGERTATVTNSNSGAPGSCDVGTADCLTVNEKPVLTALSPDSRGAGAVDALVTATGTGFRPGARLDLGAGTSSSSSGAASETEAAVLVDIDHGAAVGPRAAVLVNGDGGRSEPVADIFTVLEPPAIASVSPAVLNTGANTLSVTGTNFVAPVTLSLGPDVTFGSATVNEAGTSITVSATVASKAFRGVRDLRVVNGDAGRDVCASCTAIGSPGARTITTTGGLGSGATVRFYDRVQDVTRSNLVLRLADRTKSLPSTVRCYDLDGASESCATSTDIRRAELRPKGVLVPGERYLVVVNPPGATPILDSDGDAVTRESRRFRATGKVSESSAAVGYGWQTVADRRVHGGSYVRESRAGAAIEVPFAGDSVAWFSPGGPEFGTVRVVVDGEVVDSSLDLSRAARTGRVRHTIAGAGPGAHVLRLVVLSKPGSHGSGRFVGLDAVSDEGTLKRTPKADASWAKTRSGSATVALTDLPGTSASLAFRGKTLEITFLTGPDGGIVEVTVDGTRRRVNLYSARAGARVASFKNLADRRHSARIRVLDEASAASSGRVVRIDRFIVR